MNIFYQFIRYLKLLGCFKEFVFTHTSDAGDFTVHFAHMADCLDNIASTRFSLGTDHGSTFIDTSQSFPKIFGTTHEWYFEFSLINMVDIIGRRKNFAFIDIVNLQCLQNLGFCKMTDTTFGHNRDGYRILNLLNQLWIAHTRYAAGRTDISRDTFQCHNSAGTGSFCDLCLFWCGDVHDDTTFQHLGQLFI